MRNAELLRQVGDAIAAEPEMYNQKVWPRQVECQTACCVAGWTDTLLGVVLPIDEVDEVLGLTPDETDILFNARWLPFGADEETPREKLALYVRDALYGLAGGASIEDVTWEEGT